ncbi:P-loop containing nucleoside triphosphate hydrolase protein [Obelidium mucronatum]|nr:P-loop containing nucleoside triphosphate hydrolase protein [Obelidium mucronatum]
MRESLDAENEGSLRPVAEMITGAQMQGCLMAFLPQLINVNSGNMVVDMFIVSSLVTLIMSVIGLLGSTIRQIIDDDSSLQNDINLCVKVEFHRMDKWNEAQENVHWKALAWMITERSKQETKGQFRMIPYVPENDGDSSDEEEEELYESDITIPQFNILPLGNRELEIEYNGARFIIQFDNSNTPQQSGGEDDKNQRHVDPLINREPPILIRRIDGETATLEWMQNTLNEITKVYAKAQASKKRRARYERPADCSWWRWVQTLKSTRGLSSVALDETQETLLLKDLETFANDKDFYKRMGLPYRRGYLFSGKPGTGKTSLINAISATYNRDLYYINLQDIKSDNELQSAFASVSKNSIIVFEDIDAQSAEVHTRERRFALKKVDKMRALKEKELEIKKKKREAAEAKLIEAETADATEEEVKKPKKTLDEIWKDDDDDFSDFGMGGFGSGFGTSMMGPSLPTGMGFGDLKLGKGSLFSGFTLSMLLNCLDGHMLPENVVIIMTSNHPEVLDPALIRPGRIDLHLSLGYCTRYQMNRMYQSVMNDKEASIDFTAYPVPEHVIAPCDALRIMILYRSNPSIIPVRLMERGIELLDGKPLTTGIQAGESAMALDLKENFDSSISIDSGNSSCSDLGSENGDTMDGLKLRKSYAGEE